MPRRTGSGRNELAGRKPGRFLVRGVRGAFRRAAKATFKLWPRLGVWIISADYNAPIPQTNVYRDRHRTASALRDVDLKIEQQLARLDEFASAYGDEWARMSEDRTAHQWEYFHANNSFGRVDAEIAHAFVRALKPGSIIEVGSGMSTRVLAAAGKLNAAEGNPCDVTVIDPYPGDVVLAGIPGVDRLIRAPVEEQSVDLFTRLNADDILFIDGSHVLKPGGDVEFLLLDVLPRLRSGVVVQLHDIYLPFDYPPSNYDEGWFWTEQYVLRALLMGNPHLEVLWSAFALVRSHLAEVARAIPGASLGAEGGPCSFWLRVTR